MAETAAEKQAREKAEAEAKKAEAKAEAEAKKAATKRVRAVGIAKGSSYFDPEQAENKEIGAEPVEVELTYRVQQWLEQKQLEEVK